MYIKVVKLTLSPKVLTCFCEVYGLENSYISTYQGQMAYK